MRRVERGGKIQGDILIASVLHAASAGGVALPSPKGLQAEVVRASSRFVVTVVCLPKKEKARVDYE